MISVSLIDSKSSSIPFWGFGSICENEKGSGWGWGGGAEVRDFNLEGVFGLKGKGYFVKVIEVYLEFSCIFHDWVKVTFKVDSA